MIPWFPPAVAALCLVATSAHAGLSFEKTRALLKPKIAEDTVTAVFAFQNTGDKPVSIKEVHSNCQCLSANTDKKVYAPGEKGKVQGVFKVGSLEGYAEKFLTVESDDPKAKFQRLTVGLEVPTVVEISPDLTQWEVGDKPEPKTVTIRFIEGTPTNITTVVNSRPSSFTHKVETVKEGEEYRVIITPKHTDSPMLGVLRIENDGPYEKHRRKMAFFGVVKELREPAKDK